MKKERVRHQIVSYLYILLGCLLFAAGDVMFVNPYLLAPGGTYGLANVLNTLWPWRIGFYAICMDIPLLLIGTWILGPRFGVKTVISTILIFGATLLFESVWGYQPLIHSGILTDISDCDPYFKQTLVQILDSERYFVPDYFLNTLIAGAIYGIAIGLIFKSGSTSGGSDIISMIAHKYTKISLGTLTLIVDSCITLTTFIAFKQIRLPIYSILLIVVESKVIDLVIEGVKSYKTAFIVTDKYKEVGDFILHDLQRGGTCFNGIGMYQGQERKMIYVVLNRSELVKLKGNLHYLDPNALVNVVESSEIMGYGFKALPKED
ncbi:MAG: YitT family protein [Bacteroidales bacterium]|nr:YitT family protein [Bacteroidales bacterium]